MSGLLFAATLGTALGCGVVAGVFFAFSTFVMDALARLPSAQGIAAMQSINRAAISPLFMVALFGTAVACVVLLVAAAVRWDTGPTGWLAAGGALYLLGTILPTIAYHVPRNDRLATLEPSNADAASHWRRYVIGWTAWNHLRAAAALGAAGALTVAIHVG